MAGGDTDGSHADDGGHEQDGLEAEPASAALPGLAVSQEGYTLVPRTTSVPAGRSVPYVFTVTGPDGAPVTAYTESHEKELHFIVVRRDRSASTSTPPGRPAAWTVDLFCPRPAPTACSPTSGGRAGQRLTSTSSSGRLQPGAPPEPRPPTTSVSTWRSTAQRSRVETELVFTVSEEGTDRPAARSGLVVLRATTWLPPTPPRTRPVASAVAVRFATTFPTAGAYRLFSTSRSMDRALPVLCHRRRGRRTP
jgi:hypothetical protein